MQGRRIPDPGESWDTGKGPQNGDYWKTSDGTWHGVCPNGLFCWLKNHVVVEHEDGTISVVSTPGGAANSILAGSGSGGKTWHGYIERGDWRT